MLNLNLAAVAREERRIREEIPPDHAVWEGMDVVLLRPLAVDLVARSVGAGVLVRGTLRTLLEIPCRRCLARVEWELDEEVELLFEPLSGEEREELEGEVYPLPQGAELELAEPLREHLLLRVPAYVVCDESCRGLCPQCGRNLNEGTCECVPEQGASHWDALKKIKFD